MTYNIVRYTAYNEIQKAIFVVSSKSRTVNRFWLLPSAARLLSTSLLAGCCVGMHHIHASKAARDDSEDRGHQNDNMRLSRV